MKPKIIFVNHASVLFSYGKINLITDPWLFGSAFNNSWDLISESKLDISEFKNITHIWFSHEHPDHFFPFVLNKIPENFRKKIQVYFQDTLDHRVSQKCKELGFQVIEMKHGKFYDLTDDFKIMCKPYMLYDSWLYLQIGDKKILKQNQLIEQSIDKEVKQIIQDWPAKSKLYQQAFVEVVSNGKKIKHPIQFETLSGTRLQKVQIPLYKDWGDIVQWHLKENLPGYFPYTAGVFKWKQNKEDPTRMFAGEGCPERTNARFHFLSKGQSAIRLSTAFDSVTLYGHDPEKRLDVYGKIGNAGVNVACIDDAKKLYSGIDLNSPSTSVSMTINGPAPILMAQFFNTAIDQACEKYITENKLWPSVHKKMKLLFKNVEMPTYFNSKQSLQSKEGHNGLGLQLLGVSGDQVLSPQVYQKIKQEVLASIRGTLQADILKEDQAQNTCI